MVEVNKGDTGGTMGWTPRALLGTGDKNRVRVEFFAGENTNAVLSLGPISTATMEAMQVAH